MKVLVTEPNTWERLEAHPVIEAAGWEATYVDVQDRDALLSALGQIDAYVGLIFDAEMAKALGPRCRFVQITAAGTDHAALDSLPEGVTVSNAYGHEASVAEHVVMVTLAARRGLVDRDAALRKGIWRSALGDPSAPRFSLLAGKTVGLIGLGHIGQAIVGPFKALGVNCVATRRSGPTPPVDGIDWIADPSELDRVCEASDVLVLACPLNDETRGMIGREQLDLLGPDGCLVNVGRGGLVREDELYLALREGRLGSAALDVWSRFATLEHARASSYPFEDLPNVIMTPHYSGTAIDTYRLRTDGVAQNLERVARGEQPDNVVLIS